MRRVGALVMLVALIHLMLQNGCGSSGTGSANCGGTPTCQNVPCAGSATAMYQVCIAATAGCSEIIYKSANGITKETCTCGTGCDAAAYAKCTQDGPTKACM